MAVTIQIGDLLEATEDIIAHSVNCQGKMGSGVAKQIKENFPRAYDEYKSLFVNAEGNDFIGYIQAIDCNTKIVCNLFTQLNYGYDGQRYTSYDAMWNCLSKLESYALINNLSVAIPYKIGSDRGGANWNIVYMMIKEIFESSKVKLNIYKLEEA